MREQRLWVAAICAAFVIGMRAGHPACAAEPEYQGKPAAKWLELLTSHDDAERKSAVKAIAADPKSAKPVLDEFVRQMGDQNIPRAQRAAFHQALMSVGPAAVPALIEATRYRGPNEAYIQEVAIRLLGDMARISGQSAAVQALVELLHDTSPVLRRSAARELGHVLPTVAAGVAPALRNAAITDPDSKVRGMALLSLGLVLNWPAIHPDQVTLREIQLLRMLGNLHDRDPATVKQAVSNGGKIGSTDQKAKPVLAAMLSAPDFATRSLAAAELASIYGQVDALAVITDGVKKNEVLRPEVIELLVKFGAAAVPILLEARHRETNDHLREGLDGAVSKVKIHSEDVQTLRSLLAHEAPYVRAWATQKLLDLGDRSPATIAALAKRMADSNRSIRQKAELTLMDLGQTALSALIEIAQDKSPLVRRKAVFVITVIGEPPGAVVDALVRALDDADEQVRFWACVALGRVKNQQSRLGPLMLARQTDASERVRAAARNAFQQLTLTETGR